MLLQDLHEASDVELGVQREIVYVRNERRNFLFEAMEGVLECVIRSVGLVAVVAQIVVRTPVLSVWIMICLLFLDVGMRSGPRLLIVFAFSLQFFCDKLFDVLFGFADALREL